MNWKKYLKTCGDPITEEDINLIQRLYCFDMHTEHREFILTTNGGEPLKSSVPVPGILGGADSIDFFYSINAREQCCSFNAWCQELPLYVERGLIPLANSPFNCFFCTRSQGVECQVVYVDICQSNPGVDVFFTVLSRSLREFMDSLFDYDE